jgi:iron complex transport system substrate-binding protein
MYDGAGATFADRRYHLNSCGRHREPICSVKHLVLCHAYIDGFRALGFILLAYALNSPAGIQLQQADGSHLELEKTAERLVTLSPHLTELVFAAGAGKYLVATVEYSEYPEAVAFLPRIGDAFRIDAERILALQPDLVIAWDSGNPNRAISQLVSLGIPVWSVEIREPGEIAEVLRAIGEASGQVLLAESAAADFQRRLNELSRRYRSHRALDYFYQVDPKPLYTINGEHLISKGLSLCGGHNIFHDLPGLAFQVTHESVIVADPVAVFAPAQDSGPNPLAVWMDWPGMQAVSRNALFLLPADKISQATPRLLEALEIACSLLDDLRDRE